MKTRLIISTILCFLVWLLAGCSTPRKLAANTKETGKTEEKRSEATAGEIHTLIDSTKTAGLDIKYFKIEFYPPGEKPAGPDPEPEKEPTPANVNNEPKPANKKPPDKGAIKSIEGLIISSSNEEKGIAESHETNNSQKDEEINTANTLSTDITEEVDEDPYRWRYIFGIIVIGVGACFFLRKSKVFKAIKNIFSS